MLCPDCQRSYDAWLVPRKHHHKVNLTAIGKPTATAYREAEKRNHQDWKKLVNQQHALIRQICATKHQNPQPTLF